MNKRDDAFEILRANDPVDSASVEGVDTPKARALFVEITTTPRRLHTSQKRAIGRRLAVTVAIALLAVVSVAATWLFVRDVTDPISVGCYQGASLDSDIVGVSSGGHLDVALCEAVWDDGRLVNSAAAPAGEVPALIGCVTDTGNLAVFPSANKNLCGILGLADMNPKSVPTANALRQLDDDLVAYFAANDCRTIDDAEVDVRRMLDSRGLQDWHIAASSAAPDRPCASFGLDVPNQSVHLIAIPRPR